MSPAPAQPASPDDPPVSAPGGAHPHPEAPRPRPRRAAPGTPAGSAEGAHAGPGTPRHDAGSPASADPLTLAPGQRGGRFGLPGGLAANGPGRGTGAWASPLALTAVLVALGAVVTLLQKAPCLLHGWGAPDVYYAGCYSDWAALYGGRGFAEDPWAPFRADSTFEYPVLMSLVASVAAQITHWLPFPPEQGVLVFWGVNLLAVVGLWAVTAVLTVRAAGRRWTDGLMVAVAPGIILAGTVNWDLWAVALLAGGMLAWLRGRPGWAGVLIGLGAATKLYPLLILGPMLVLALRSRRFGPFLQATAGAVVAWLAVNLPLMLTHFDSWAVFFTFSSERGPGLSSVWNAWDVMAVQAGWPLVPEGRLSLYAWGAFAVCCAGVLVLGLAARRTPRLAQLAFLVVAAFVLTNKVYSPQFVVWLVPLAALAVPRWKDFWVWQGVEALHFFAVWMYLAGATSGSMPQHSMDDSVYVAAIFAHMVALLWLCGRVVAEVLSPEDDLVRGPGGDPARDPDSPAFRGDGLRRAVAS
ncbi:glycosyltransferase family 87 protein [Micrococcus sp.]|uniref:glycosyltransferase family 87 protein n=1 Tax=Micrococcus sp. TaxID=1271 RepID=UPI002A90DA49|nr:glycosyltransferase 87 family protein [Micrococcus sp.]MDY6054548.1 glycosyltransferase 87 family protein [Micrococcus sp.]